MENGTKRRPQDSLWVIGLFALVVGFVVRLIFDGMSAWPYAAVSAAFLAGWTVWLVRRRRRHDAATTGTEADDVPAMERQVLKGGPAPQDPRRRQAMAAFVASRQERIRRNSWWALPLLAVLFFGVSALCFASGSVTAGGWTLALAVVFMTWFTWYNRRFARRLEQMRRRLQS
ncbi:hypothetical protein [Streptomyces glaucus]|uniref:Transmembrane protein n=1 Tax=Streptomyces glaucus TaxID=284029 RepID=A0ABN3JDF7_9ACTN